MKYIKDFKEEDKIIDYYFCKEKQTNKSKNEKKYLSLKLQDKTGIIDAKIWDINKDIQNFDQGDYIKIEGTVVLYQDNLQLRVNRIRKGFQGEYNLDDYIRKTEKNISSLIMEVQDYINSMDNIFIKTLMNNIFIENEEINTKFKVHSAAKTMHHAYMGGLIEHTLSVMQVCDLLSKHYDNVNRDLLLAIAMLHDLGKVYELSEFPTNDYTEDGQLLGHILICTEIINAEADKIENFPHQLKTLLKHGVISHHGEYEYGSPKKPKIVEAYIVHMVDTMDSKINMFSEFLGKNSSKGNWAGYNRVLTRNIRNSNFEG